MQNSTEFKNAYATVILGTDALLGGNITEPTGAKHFLAHQWTSGEPFPKIFDDSTAQELRANGGVEKTDKTRVKEFVRKYNLLDLPSEVTRLATDGIGGTRAEVIGRTMTSVQLMLTCAYAKVTGEKGPSFEEKYTSVTGQAPEIHDPMEARERLQAALASLGAEVTQSTNLPEVYEAWRKENLVPPDELNNEMHRINGELLELTRKNVLSRVNFSIPGHDPHLGDVAFDGLEFNVVRGVPFTGVSLYSGGERADGGLLLKGSIGRNQDHPLTRADVISFFAHEGIPGHYFHFAVTDIARRAGNLGPETSIFTIGTPETTMYEGFGQCALQIAYGGAREAVIDALGPEFAVLFAAEDLDELGRHDAPVHFQERAEQLDSVKGKLQKEYALPSYLVNKIGGAWTQDPIIGPMWSPLYLIGGQTIRKGLGRRGLEKVLEVALHTKGYVDYHAFKKELEL